MNEKVFSTYSRAVLTLEYFTFTPDGQCCLEGRAGLPTDGRIIPQLCVTKNESCRVLSLCPCAAPLAGNEEHQDNSLQWFRFKYRFNIFETTDTKIVFYLLIGNEKRRVERFVFGRFFPVSTSVRYSYCCCNGYMLSAAEDGLFISQVTKVKVFKRECLFLIEIWKSNRLGAKKAVLARSAYHFLRPLVKKPIWIISDRIDRAGDNGEAFFRYLTEKHSGEASFFFAVKSSSADYQRMKQYGKVVPAYSFRHKLLHLLCEYEISSQLVDLFNKVNDLYRDILPYKKNVFLQHGVTKDDVSRYTGRESNNLFGFVTSSLQEQLSIASESYGYTMDNVWLTGMPRYDALRSEPEKVITVMPTWRKYLVSSLNMESGARTINDDFQASVFYKKYSALLEDSCLRDALRKYGYRLRFVLHPNMIFAAKYFPSSESIEVMQVTVSYPEVFSQSSLIITDYSSSVFDFAYLRKPVIYYQFDRESFFSGSHMYQKGYFDYAADGFGEVELTCETLVDRIVEYMANGCEMKTQYRERVDRFFAFHDRNCCERVYKKLIER